jgi:hypothetical protein
MIRCGRGVVGRSTVTDVVVLDQPQLLEQLQGAIDRRDVHRPRLLVDRGEHLVGGRVAEAVDRP